MGAQSALGRRRVDDEVLRVELGFLADRVATRLRAKERAGRTVTVRVRFVGMQSVTRSVTLPAAISATRSLAEIGVGLAQSALADHPDEREITLLAISVRQPRSRRAAPARAAARPRRRAAPGGARRRARPAGRWTGRWTGCVTGSAATRSATPP